MLTADSRQNTFSTGKLVAAPETRQQIVAEAFYDLVPELQPPAAESALGEVLPDPDGFEQQHAIDALARAVAFPSNIDTDTLEFFGQELDGDRQTAGLLEYIAQQADTTLARAANIFSANEDLNVVGDRLASSFQETIEPGLSTLEIHWEGSPATLEALQNATRALAADLRTLNRTRASLDRAANAILDQPAFAPDRRIARTAAATVGEDVPTFIQAAAEFAVLPKDFSSRQQFQEKTIDYLAQFDRVAERASALDSQLQELNVRDTSLDSETFATTIESLRAGLHQNSERSLQASVTEASQEFVRALHTAATPNTVSQAATNETPASVSQLLRTVQLERLAQAAAGELAQAQALRGVEVTEVTLGENARLSQLDEERFSIAVDARDRAQSNSITFEQSDRGIEFENPPEDLTEFIRVLNLSLQQELFSRSAATLASLPDAPGESEEDVVGAAVAGLGVAANLHEGGNAGRASIALSATNSPKVDGSRIKNTIDRYEANRTPEAVLRDVEPTEEERQEELGLELRPGGF